MKKIFVNYSIYAVWTILFLLVVGGFFLFSTIIGGSADYIEQGKYFVSNHGEISEVSRMIYSISYIWEIIFFLSFPIYFVGLFVISKIQNRIEKRQNMFE